MRKLLSFVFAVCILGSVAGYIYACNQPVDECEENCEVSVTPSVTPTPTPELTGTPTATPSLVTSVFPTPPTCGESEHLNLQGDKCLRFELGGAPSSDEQGTPFKMQGEDTVHGPQK